MSKIIQFKKYGNKDKYGRIWGDETLVCSECGQPDSCGDCSHGPLLDKEVLLLGGKLP